MTNHPTLEHCYEKEFDTKVKSVKDGKFVVLENTLFYAEGGGQPHDNGTLIRKSDSAEFSVVFVGTFDGMTSHQIENSDGVVLHEGDEVHGTINWTRRYKIMRMHTAAHLMCAIIDREEGKEGHPVKFTGSQLGEEKSRFDVNLEEYNPERMQAYIKMANEIITSGQNLEIGIKSREEALQDPNIVKLAKGFDESIKEVRLVKIGDIDLQPCGGTHLANIKEIGKIEFLKAENKGKGNRRVYYTVE